MQVQVDLELYEEMQFSKKLKLAGKLLLLLTL
jgi:hypothetical protein